MTTTLTDAGGNKVTTVENTDGLGQDHRGAAPATVRARSRQCRRTAAYRPRSAPTQESLEGAGQQGQAAKRPMPALSAGATPEKAPLVTGEPARGGQRQGGDPRGKPHRLHRGLSREAGRLLRSGQVLPAHLKGAWRSRFRTAIPWPLRTTAGPLPTFQVTSGAPEPSPLPSAVSSSRAPATDTFSPDMPMEPRHDSHCTGPAGRGGHLRLRLVRGRPSVGG